MVHYCEHFLEQQLHICELCWCDPQACILNRLYFYPRFLVEWGEGGRNGHRAWRKETAQKHTCKTPHHTTKESLLLEKEGNSTDLSGRASVLKQNPARHQSLDGGSARAIPHRYCIKSSASCSWWHIVRWHPRSGGAMEKKWHHRGFWKILELRAYCPSF